VNLLIKSPGEAPGVYPLVRRGRELKHLSFTVVQLGGALSEHVFESGGEELALDFYSGPVRVEAEWSGGRWAAQTGPRESIRLPGPMIYLPASSRVRISLLNGTARITVAGASGAPGVAPRFIGAGDAVGAAVGKGTWSRTVWTHIADNIEGAHLIAGETVTEPGGWSSFPPHKHDRFAPPSEVPMEEVYYFQAEPKNGFGFIRVYTDPDDPEPLDCAYAVGHGDTVLLPRGYHPVATSPGYVLNYNWVLAGEARKYGAWREDPAHSWIRTA